MTVYVRSRGRWFTKRDGKGGEMIKITREPVAFENLSAEELARDSWLEVVDAPAANVKKKRAKKAAKPKPAEPKPEESPADSFSFGKAETAESLPPLKPEGLID